MNGVESYVISVCSAMIICGVINVIYPSGNMKNTVKILTVIFIIAVCVTPFVNFEDNIILSDFDISKNYDIKTDLQDYVNNAIIDESKNQLLTELGEVLSERGITDYSIKFEGDNDNDLSQITLYIKQKSDGLKEYLESKLDVEINVVEE